MILLWHFVFGRAVQVAAPFPGFPFVFGNGGHQRPAPVFQIVMDRDPVAVFQGDNFKAGAGIEQFAVFGTCPGDAVILRISNRARLSGAAGAED